MRLFSRHTPQMSGRRHPAAKKTFDEDLEPNRERTFKRGRTLTGSSSVLVHSTNESQADMKSSRVHTHILLKKRRHVGGLLVLTLVAALVFFGLLHQFTGHIIVQATPDPSLQLEDRYAGAINSYLLDHPAERLRFFLNLGRLTTYVKTMVPEIESVNVDGSGGLGVSVFSVSVRRPVASWNTNGKQLFVDRNGVPFDRNYYASPNLTVTDRSGISASSGQTIASSRFMGFVGQIIGQAKEKGYEVTDIIIPPDMTRQVEIRLQGISYPVKFSSDRGAGESVEDMKRAVEWMKTRGASPQYIDVRVKGKAFYR